MTKIEEFLSQWRDAREGLIAEAERIPEDKFDFRAAAETRSVLELLYHASLAASGKKVTQFGEEKLDQMITGFDGQQVSKTAMLQFTLAHEMYHRGQLTVYQRLLGIEPALTERFRRFASPNQ